MRCFSGCLAGELSAEDSRRLHTVCTRVVPGWQDLELSQLEMSPLRVDANKQHTYQVSVFPESRKEPSAPTDVSCKLLSNGICLETAAIGDMSEDAQGASVCGRVFLVRGAQPACAAPVETGWFAKLPQNMLIMEHPTGAPSNAVGTGGVKGSVYDKAEDAAAYGRLLGLLHQRDSEWFRSEGHNKLTAQQLETLIAFPEWVSAEIMSAARQARFGNTILEPVLHMTVAASNLKDVYGSSQWLTELTDIQKRETEAWHGAVAKMVGEIMAPSKDWFSSKDLMDRLVVCHGDAHGGQFCRPAAEGSGAFVLRGFESMQLAPAYHDFGAVLVDWLLEKGGFEHPSLANYPSLANRKAAAQAYLDSFGSAEAAQYTRNTVDDIVYDMNKAVAPALVAAALQRIHQHGVKQANPARSATPRYLSWALLAIAECCTRMMSAARKDETVCLTIYTKGLLPAVLESLPKNPLSSNPMTFWSDEEDARNVMLNVANMSNVPLGPLATEANAQAESCTLL